MYFARGDNTVCIIAETATTIWDVLYINDMSVPNKKQWKTITC